MRPWVRPCLPSRGEAPDVAKPVCDGKKKATGGAGGQVREDPLIVRPDSMGGDEGFALTSYSEKS